MMISKLILTITSMTFLLIAPVSVAVQESVAAIEEPAGDIDDATPQSRRLQAGEPRHADGHRGGGLRMILFT